MSRAIPVLPKAILEIVGPRPMVRDGAPLRRARSQSKPSLPSRIAVIGNYLPRQCGIATFTTDLCEAVATAYPDTACFAVPVNDCDEGYDYPPRVRFELAQNDTASYRRAADFLNGNNVDLV